MVSKSILAAKKAKAAESMAADLHAMAGQQDMMFEWLAQAVVAIDQRLKAIEAVTGIQYVPPPLDGEEGEETPPSPEPTKPKRGRPRKVKTDG